MKILNTILSLIFATAASYALSPTDVCSKISNTFTKNDCLSVVNSSRYFDRDAVAACDKGAGSNGFTIVDCMKTIADKSFRRDLALACINTNGLLTVSCLKQNGQTYSPPQNSVANIKPNPPSAHPQNLEAKMNLGGINVSMSVSISGQIAEVAAVSGTSCDPNFFKPGFEELSRALDSQRRSFSTDAIVISSYLALLEGALLTNGSFSDQRASGEFWATIENLEKESFRHYSVEKQMLLLNTIKSIRGYTLLLESILDRNPNKKNTKRALFEQICRRGTE